MSAADKAKEIVQDLTGMWWPEGDEDQLREAARAWRTYADDVEDCTAACHKRAQDVIDNNKGQSIDAFETFWRKYHGGGKGYLDDLATAARDMAKALDKFADQIAEAKRKIEHELEIAGAVLVAGTALALFTGGISEVAAAGATEAIVAAAGTAGVAVSATVAEIAGTVLATAAIGGIEAITVDVVVAQGGRNLLGDQKGINVAEMQQAGVAGLLMGGAFGGAGRAARAFKDSGGLRNVFHGLDMDVPGPRLALAGEGPVGPTSKPLMRNSQGASGGSSGKAGEWVAKGDLKGSAAGKTIKRPHHRHTPSGSATGEIKPKNTVILRGYEKEVDKDLAGIANGEAKLVGNGNEYEINGRKYAIEPNGTSAPISGPGFAELDRNEYAALQQIAKAKGNLDAAPQLTKAPRFVNNPHLVQKALSIYEGTYTP
ncbi:WXG100 family type VII secretion target [Streptomyces decoyicus]